MNNYSYVIIILLPYSEKVNTFLEKKKKLRYNTDYNKDVI